MIAGRALLSYLDGVGLGSGPVEAEPIGDGHSNLTYLLRRGGERFVLRRPPAGAISRSANDVVREARVLEALAATSVPVPEVLAICEDEDVIGVPFFLAGFVEGRALVVDLPPRWGAEEAKRAADGAVEALLTLHATDLEASGLGAFGRPDGYLERQLRRFSGLLEENATRPLPQLDRVGEWLADNLPPTQVAAFVHGDFRLGNLLFDDRGDVGAVLDWEMATTGDPLADLGYMTAMWAEEGDLPTPMTELSRVTKLPPFPRRSELARRYAEGSGLALDALPWYQVLALWKAAIFLEGSYRRYRAGASEDRYFAALDEGVPALAAAALARAERA